MIFHEGDRVLVRHHTDQEKNRYSKTWMGDMDDFEGQIVIVDKVHIDIYDECQGYRLNYNGFMYWFAPDSVQSCYDQF